MSLLTPVVWSTLSKAKQDELLMRPAVLAGVEIAKTVDAIVKDVRERGDAALRDYAAKFDRIELKEIRVSPDEINEAETRLDADTKAAMQLAVKNIRAFHSAQALSSVTVQNPTAATFRKFSAKITQSLSPTLYILFISIRTSWRDAPAL